MARKPNTDRAVPRPMGLLAPSTLRMPPQQPQAGLGGLTGGDVDVDVQGMPDGVHVDPATGATVVDAGDGGVIVDFEPQAALNNRPSKFGDNLAERIDASELARIAEDLLLGIEQDDMSRRDWLATRAHGLRLLGLNVETPKTGGASDSTAVESQSVVRHPLLLEATVRFQSNSTGELLPASGPVKITDSVKSNARQDGLAEALETDMNYYLTSVAREYYPDTDRLLFYVGFGGCGFKKVYNCPVRRRPVSESVDAKDLIVSDAATDLHNSKRVTHQITMGPSRLKRMQLAKAYRDVYIPTPNPVTLNDVDQEIADTQGVKKQMDVLEKDRDHTIYECYCELDIRGFEDKQRGEPTGLALPYRVVIEKDSRTVLEVRRNWSEEDDLKLPKICFVKYSFVPALGFYDIGLIHLLGNTTNALTAAWREMLDAGMFANFPGFIYAKSAARQNTTDFRVPPGGGVGIDTNGQPISNMVMPLPYKDVSPAFAQLADQIAQTGQRLGGTAELNVGEGKQDAPVGTTLALLEQATKTEAAVHKRLHKAQSEEFALLKECFRENPKAFIDAVKPSDTPLDWTIEQFTAALNDVTLQPQADPNTPSHMHRLIKAQALVQIDRAYPGVLNSKEIVRRAIAMLGEENPESLFAQVDPNAAPQIPPEAMLKMQELKMKQDDAQQRAAQASATLQQKQNDAMQKAQATQSDLSLKQNIAQTDAASKQQDLHLRMQIASMEAAHKQADLALQERMATADAHADQREHDGNHRQAGLELLSGIVDHAHERAAQQADHEHEAGLQKAELASAEKVAKQQKKNSTGVAPSKKK